MAFKFNVTFFFLMSTLLSLNVYDDPVLTPCNHAFCRYEEGCETASGSFVCLFSECIERAVTLTKNGSAMPMNQCPVCKAKTTKRSLNPSTRLAALAKDYEALAREYSKIIADENWMYDAGLKGSESYYTGGGKPLDNLSQLFPYPEKPRQAAAINSQPPAPPQPPSSPLIHSQPAPDELSLGFNTLAALDQIELPSTPDIIKRHDLQQSIQGEKQTTDAEESSSTLLTGGVISSFEFKENRTTQLMMDSSNLSTQQSAAAKSNPSPSQLTDRAEERTQQQMDTANDSKDKSTGGGGAIDSVAKTSSRATSKIRIKGKTVKVDGHSTSAQSEPPSSRAEDLLISTSGVKGDGLVKLAKFCEHFKIPILPELSDSSILVLTTDSKLVVTKRTIKYFEALLQPEKYALVSLLWIDACLKAKRIVPHLPFAIVGDQVSMKKQQQQPQRPSKSSSQASTRNLFANHRFYFYGTFSQPPPDQLANLLLLAGSEVVGNVEELPQLAKSYKCMVLVDASSQVDYEAEAEIIRRFPILASTWVLDCFSCKKVIDYKEYLIL